MKTDEIIHIELEQPGPNHSSIESGGPWRNFDAGRVLETLHLMSPSVKGPVEFVRFDMMDAWSLYDKSIRPWR